MAGIVYTHCASTRPDRKGLRPMKVCIPRRVLPALLIMAPAAVLAALAGCGAAGPSTSTPESKDPATITFWHGFTQQARLDAMDRIIKRFEEEHPGVTVIAESMDWPVFRQRWRKGLETGDLPDISTASNLFETAELMHTGLLQPVDDIIDAIGRDRFSANVLADSTHRGALYAIPYYSHSYVLWYRTNLLDKTGVAVPTTWEEFAQAAKELTDSSIDAYGYAMPMNPNDYVSTLNLHMYVYSGGGSLLNDDLTANLTSDLALEGIRYWTDIYRECSPLDSKEDTTIDQATMFYNGTTAFDFNSGFHIEGVLSTRPDLLNTISCAPLPKMHASDDDYSAVVTHIPLMLYKDAKNPELCAEFLEFLFEEDVYIDFLDSVPVGMLPTISGIRETERYCSNEIRQQFAAEEDIIENAVLAGHALGFEHGPNLQAGLLTSSGVIERMFLDIVENGTPIEEAAQAAEDELNSRFASVVGMGEDAPVA